MTISYAKKNNFLFQFFIPTPLRKFFYDYNHSKFIEFNHHLANINQLALNKNDERLKKILNSLNYLTKTLEEMKKSYTLVAGTLLGMKIKLSVKEYLKKIITKRLV